MKNIKSDRWLYSPACRPPMRPFAIKFIFTTHEQQTLLKILKIFDKEKAFSFLFRVSTSIPHYARFKNNPFPKDAIEGNLNNLKKCRKALERILHGFNPDPQRNFDSIKPPIIEELPWVICVNNAEKAYPHIKAIEKTLEGVLTKNKRGRGTPQADQEGFVSEVAKLYKQFFGREPGRNKGTIFYKLITELFKILDIKQDGEYHDPLRAIQRAVRGRRTP